MRGYLFIRIRVRPTLHSSMACPLAALLAWSPGAHAAVSVRTGSDEAQTTRVEAFDATFQRVIGPESLDSTTAGYDADLERLRTLLPASDRVRESRFRSVYCGSSR